jgi:UDP-glucose 4-epimerase
MKYVVIGGGGFIGSHLTEALINRHKEVAVFDRSSALYLNELSKKGAEIVTGDFLVTESLRGAIKNADIIFHLISTTVPKTSNDNLAFDIESNLIGTINMLNIARQEGVSKVVFSSSGGTVYGIPREVPIAENHPTNPISSYGIVKLAIEKYAYLFWKLYNLDFCILRIANAYGERQLTKDSQGIIPSLISKGLEKQEIQVWGDGSIVRDYIHVSDIVSAFIMASEYQGNEKLFNIGSGQGTSVNELIQIVESQLGRSLVVKYELSRPFDVPANILDITNANQILHWTPKMHIAEGIKGMIQYLRNQQSYG